MDVCLKTNKLRHESFLCVEDICTEQRLPLTLDSCYCGHHTLFPFHFIFLIISLYNDIFSSDLYVFVWGHTFFHGPFLTTLHRYHNTNSAIMWPLIKHFKFGLAVSWETQSLFCSSTFVQPHSSPSPVSLLDPWPLKGGVCRRSKQQQLLTIVWINASYSKCPPSWYTCSWFTGFKKSQPAGLPVTWRASCQPWSLLTRYLHLCILLLWKNNKWTKGKTEMKPITSHLHVRRPQLSRARYHLVPRKHLLAYAWLSKTDPHARQLSSKFQRSHTQVHTCLISVVRTSEAK